MSILSSLSFLSKQREKVACTVNFRKHLCPQASLKVSHEVSSEFVTEGFEANLKEGKSRFSRLIMYFHKAADCDGITVCLSSPTHSLVDAPS